MAIIEFEGLGEELLTDLTQARDGMVGLRKETVAEGEALKQMGAEGAKSTKELANNIKGTADALLTMGRQAEKSAKAQAAAVATSRQEAAKAIAANKALTEAEKEVAAAAGGITKEYAALKVAQDAAFSKGVEQANRQIGLLQQLASRVDILKQKLLAAQTQDQAAAINDELQDAVAAYDQVANASKRSSQVIKQGLQEQVGILDQLSSRVDLLRDKLAVAQTPEQVALINDELVAAVAAYEEVANASKQSSDEAQKGLNAELGLLEKLSSRVDLLKQKLATADTPEAIAAINDELSLAKDQYDAMASASKASAAEQAAALKAPIGLLSQLSSRVELLSQKKTLLTDPKEIAKVNAELDQAKKNLDKIANAGQGENSLRTQLREAREELDRIVEASGGQITPELIAAAKKAGELQDRFGDLNATVQAFNPDTKFRAVTGLLSNMASGAQAVAAGMGLFGEESEDVNRALLKIQQTTAFFQGFQGFIGGLADNWKNLKTVILASSLATKADTVSKVANAGATTGAAVATTGFAGTLNALKAALLANPITAVAVAVLALGAAFFAATRDTREYADEVERLNEHLDETSKKQFERIDQKTRLANIQAEQDALKAGDTEEAKRRKDAEVYQNNRAALLAKQFEYEANIAANRAVLAQLEGKSSDEAIKARELATKAIADYEAEYRQVAGDIMALEGENTNANLQFQLKQTDDRRAAAREKLKIEEQLAADILAAQEAVAAKAKQLEEQGADPRRRLALQRDASLEEIHILEQTLERKIALDKIERKLGADRFKELSEAQKNAQADALIDSGAVTLGAKQQEQITAAQMAVWDKYWQDRLTLERENSATLRDLQADGFEKDREVFDTDLKLRVEKLRLAGAEEIAIAQFIQRERDKFRSGQVGNAIAEEEKLTLARIDAQKRGAETEAAFRYRIELEKLAAQESAAQARLDALKDDTSEEAELTRLLLQGVLNDIDAKRNALRSGQPKLDLFDLLGLDLNDDQKQQLNAALQSFGQSLQSIAQTFIASQQAQVDAQISATDQLIEDQQRRREELQAQLDQALEDQKDGYANNADAIRAQIALTEAAEQEAQNSKRSMIEEQKRLAKQQLAIDSALQISALITANARLFEKGALLGPIGIASAGAAALAMLALVAGIKARVRALNSDVPTFRKGGILEGPSHEGGGVAMIDRRGVKFAEAEGGEYVVNKGATSKYRGLLDAINEDDIPASHHKAIMEMLASEGVMVSEEKVREIVTVKERLIQRQENSNADALKGLEKRMDLLIAEVSVFRGQEKDRPQTTVLPDGRIIVKSGNDTHIIKPRKP